MALTTEAIAAANRLNTGIGVARQSAQIQGAGDQAVRNDLSHATVRMEALSELASDIRANLAASHHRLFGESVVFSEIAGNPAGPEQPPVGLLDAVHGEIDRLGIILDHIQRIEASLRRV